MEQTPKVAAALATAFWRGLRHPLLALFLALPAAGLVAAGTLLPQLPGQLRDEPATAARWLLNAGSAQGMWGNLWLGLGLFDILHSPLTALLGILLALALSAHLAAQIATILQMRAAQRALGRSTGPAGTPLAIAAAPGLGRSRLAIDTPPEESAQQVQTYLK